ncbi:hypothetical protein Q0F98_34285 [Paenibacillus amylolyticus]|nr:hypothetical protein Q0F98_34285 [Paenibacillus amylolyticus]
MEVWTENSAGEKSEIKRAAAKTFPYPPSAWSGGSTPSPNGTSEQADELSSQPEPSKQPELPAKKISNLLISAKHSIETRSPGWRNKISFKV